jgi:hypothetical protein
MQSCTKAEMLLGALGLCFALGACADTLSPDKFRQNLASYSVLPGNKALFMNAESFRMNWAYSAPTPQAAVDNAKTFCEATATENGEDARRCVPVAINDRQVYDPISGQIDEQNSTAQQLQQLQQVQSLMNGMRR